VSYQTAYLKWFYPKEFLAGILNDRLDKIEEISKYVVYMKEKKIPVLPPDVNKSRAEFRVEGDGVRFGLCALRGAGEDVTKKIVEERTEHGDYKSFQDFLMRCTKFINKKVAECLILSGAFDRFGYHRSQYYAVYEDAMARIAGTEKSKNGAQISLFGSIVEEPEITIDFPDIPEFEYSDMLSKEKQVLGVYISGHPFEQYKPYFKNCTFDCSFLNDYEEDEDGTITYNNLKSGQAVTMGGIISAIKKLNTKQGSSMAFVTVEDLYGSIECIAFPNVYEKIKTFLAVDTVVALSGKVDVSDGEKKAVILLDGMKEFTLPETKSSPASPSSAVTYASAPSAPPAQNVLWLNASGLDDGEFEELQEMLSAYRGDTAVKVLRGTQKFRYPAGITRSKAFEAELRTFLPADCIKFV
jgi:DNA polymerase-3 subunit alpha